MSDPLPRRSQPRWGRLALGALGIALLAWVLVAKGGVQVLLDVVQRVGFRWPLLLVPFLLSIVVTMLAYRAALPGGGRAVPWRVMIHAERSSTVLASLLPLGNSGGNIAKLVLLRHWYLSDEIIAAGVWGAIGTGLCHSLGAVGPIVAVAHSAVPKPEPALLLAAANVVMALPALAILLSVRRGLSERVAKLVALLPGAFVARRRDPMQAWASKLDRHLAAAIGERRSEFVHQLGYKAAVQAIRIAEIWLAVELIDAPGGLATAVLYNALSRAMTMAFSFVPGQLGVLEMTSMLGFAGLGFTPEIGLSLALVLRFRYVINMLISATALGTSATLLTQYPARSDREILASRG